MQSLSWAVVIPAYHAARTIQAVITGVLRYFSPEAIVVVDDGSSDETADKVRGTGASLIYRKDNGGKGRALRDGFERVLAGNFDWILCLDADGQHDPDVIPQFQAAALTGRYDLIIGDRSRNSAVMPLSRRFSNRASSALLSLRTGLKLPDVQCGYRAIRAQTLRGLQLQAESYDIEVEMILQTWRIGGRIGWISVPTIYQGEPSFLRKVPETVRFIRLFLRSYYEQVH